MTSQRLAFQIVTGAAVLGLATGQPNPLAAQNGQAPANVTVQASGSTVTVAWAQTKTRGVTYRVLRSLDARAPGTDIIKPVMDLFTGADPDPIPGTTYFYQVVATYNDGTSGAAMPVGFTVPKLVAPVAPVALAPATGAPRALAPGGAPAQTLLAAPTAVTNISVTGTTASATVTWQPVRGAVSYSVTRAGGGLTAVSFPGLTITTLTDQGYHTLGFLAGTYLYTVTATLGDGTAVSGQASWTRPNPTCAPPGPNQPVLAVLSPATSQAGRYPGGATFLWTSPVSVIAVLVERSVQGSSGWAVAGTSCSGPNPVDGSIVLAKNVFFADALGGIVPNTGYLYRITVFAATGEVGISTVPWTAPARGLVRWLSATAAAGTVTLRWRYEPPTSNAPALPNRSLLTSPFGLNQLWNGGDCSSLSGCNLVIQNVPTGMTHTFTASMLWGQRSLGILSADTTITVP